MKRYFEELVKQMYEAGIDDTSSVVIRAKEGHPAFIIVDDERVFVQNNALTALTVLKFTKENR